MKRLFLLACLALSMTLGTLTMGGCNTISGMGKDTRETGDVITGTPPREAYHQDARDF